MRNPVQWAVALSRRDGPPPQPGVVGITRSVGRRWAGDRGLAVAAGLAAALPVMVAVIRAVSADWAPLGDNAIVAIRAFDVFSPNPPLVGQSSSGATGVLDQRAFSPGPLLFWLFALPARFLPPGSLPAVAGLVNIAAVLGVVGLARRRGGLALMFASAVAIPVMLLSLPGEAPSDVWNSSVPLLPFLLLIFVGWSVACGDAWLLPVMVLLASFVAQSHLTYAAPALAIVVVAVLGLLACVLWPGRTGERLRSARRWALVSLAVGLVCWSAPLVDQAVHRPGNFVLLARAASTDEPTLGYDTGARAVVRMVGVRPWWLEGPRGPLERISDVTVGPARRGVISTAAVLAALLAVAILGWRRRRVDVCTAGALGLVLCAVAALNTASTPVNSSATIFYTLRWTSPAGMAIWLLLGWSLATLALRGRDPPAVRGPRVAGLAAAAVAGAISATAAAPASHPFDEMRAIAAAATAMTPHDGTVRVDRSGPLGGILTMVDVHAGLVFAMRRDGRAVQAPPLAEKIGAHYRPGPYEHLLRVDVDQRPPPGGRTVARLSVPETGTDPREVVVTLWPERGSRRRATSQVP